MGIYRVSHFTWNLPRLHAATEASELPGNECHNIDHSCRMHVGGFRATWSILYFMYVCVRVRARARACVRTYVCMYVCMYACIYIYVYIMCVCVCVCVCVWINGWIFALTRFQVVHVVWSTS
jgi:hypothetical protein